MQRNSKKFTENFKQEYSKANVRANMEIRARETIMSDQIILKTLRDLTLHKNDSSKI